MYLTPLKVLGAPVSTLCSETFAAVSFLRKLTLQKLLSPRKFLQFPSSASIQHLAGNGTVMMIRQLAINVAFISSTRIAQSLDATGVAGAAYGIVNQIYTVGFVLHVALQGAAAAVVPSIMSKDGKVEGQRMADRIFALGCLTGCILGGIQLGLIPWILPLFTNSFEVQEAARIPAILSCILHVINGPRFAGEGIIMGLQSFRDLTIITLGSVGMLLALFQLTSLGKSLPGVMLANVFFCSSQALGLLLHFLLVGRLSCRMVKHQEELKSA
jgi:Na+-driven multidrug efflux pump